MKRVEIRLRLFPGIFQRRFSILDNLWLLNTAKIFQPDQLNPKTGKAVTLASSFAGLPVPYSNFISAPFYASMPNSSGRKRGQTFSDDVMTDAARRVPISTALPIVFP